MLIGIDWGGTKIEGVAMERDGRELLRLREATPRHDYEGCLTAIRAMVDALEQKTARKGQVGIGIPGSLEPKSRLGKGASSTWILESRLKPICTVPLSARSGSRTTPIALPPRKRWTGQGPATTSSSP